MAFDYFLSDSWLPDRHSKFFFLSILRRLFCNKKKLLFHLLNLPTKICGIISVIETFSLSIASGVDGGGSLSSFLSRIEFVGHSINSGYSVLTASNPPKQMQKNKTVVYFEFLKSMSGTLNDLYSFVRFLCRLNNEIDRQ